MVNAYSKSVAAAKFLEYSWKKIVTPECPNWTLAELDPVQVRPYIQGATKVAAVDFAVDSIEPRG